MVLQLNSDALDPERAPDEASEGFSPTRRLPPHLTQQPATGAGWACASEPHAADPRSPGALPWTSEGGCKSSLLSGLLIVYKSEFQDPI